MADDFEVVGRIRVEDDGNSSIDNLNRGLDQMEQHAGSSGGAFASFGEMAGTALALVGGAALGAAGAFVGLALAAVQPYAEYERNTLSLQAMIAMQDMQGESTSRVIGHQTVHIALTGKQSDAADKLRERIQDLQHAIDDEYKSIKISNEKYGEYHGKKARAQSAVDAHSKAIGDLNYNIAKNREAMADAQSQLDKLNGGETRTVDILEKTTKGTMSLTEARAAAAPKARELLDYTTRLGVLSPFKVEDVTNVLMLGMRMGESADTAKGMTTALVDYGAAMGLSSAKLSQLGYAISEVNSQGKLSGMTLRMLTRDGMSMDVLTNALGMSSEELTAKVKAGAISAQQLDDAFMKFTSNNFGGEANRQAHSWSGLLTTLDSIKDVALREFFEGTFKAIQPLVSQFVDTISNPDFLASLNAIGMQLGEGLSQVVPVVQGVITTILGLFGQLQTSGLGGGLFSSLTAGASTVLSTLAPTISGIVALFQQLAGWFTDNWPIIRNAFVSTWSTILSFLQTTLGQIVATVQVWLGIIINAVKSHGDAVASNLLAAWQKALAMVQPVLDAISTVIQTVLTTIRQFLQAHGTEIQNFIGGAWVRISQIVLGVVEVLQATIVPVFNFIAKYVTDNQKAIQAAIGLVWDTIQLVINTALDLIQGVITVALDLLHGNWSKAWTDIQQVVVNIWHDIETFFTTDVPRQMIAAGKSTIEGLVKGLEDNAGKVLAALGKIVQDAIQHVKDLIDGHSPSMVFFEIGQSMMLGMAGGVAGAAGVVRDALSDVYGMMSPNAGTFALQAAGGSHQAPGSTSTESPAAPSTGPLTVQLVVDGKVLTQVVMSHIGDALYDARQGAY